MSSKGEMIVRFMLLFVANEEEWLALDATDRDEAVRRIGEWFSGHAREGRIREGARLQSARSAKTVRLGRAGRSSRPVITDGPFVESKESVGSYAIIEAPDEEMALEVASSWPGGGMVEVRPLAE